MPAILPVGNTTVEFYVEAEDGTVGDTYTFTILREEASSDASLFEIVIRDDQGNVLLANNDQSPIMLTFNPATLKYDLYVTRDIEFVQISATKTDEQATLYGDLGTEELTPGAKNTYKLYVIAEDGTTTSTYTLNVHVYNQEVSVTNIIVDGYTLDFDEQVFSYDLGEVAYDVNQLNITVETSDPYATVEGDGIVMLVDGDNTLTITATSEDQLQSVSYTISVSKEEGSVTGPLSDDATISNIELDHADGTSALEFDPNVTTYEVELDNEQMYFTVDVDAADKAVVSGEGIYQIEIGETKNIVVKSVSEDGENELIYYIKVTRETPSDDDELKSLIVIENGVSRILDHSLNYQEVILDELTTEVEIKVEIGEDAKVSGDGILTIDSSEILHHIIVTAEDGSNSIYSILFVKYSDDATLNLLEVYDVATDTLIPFNPTFNQGVYTYAIDLSDQPLITDIEIYAEANDPNVYSITGLGTFVLSSGNGTTTDRFTVEVTAEDQVTQLSYMIEITRDVVPEHDISIDELSLVGEGVTYLANGGQSALNTFISTTTDYTISVPYALDEVYLSVTNQNGASIYGAGRYTLDDKETNITFYLVSKSGIVQSSTYSITVVKEDPSSDNLLKEITLDNQLIEGFDPEIKSYTIKIKEEDYASILVNAIANDDKSIVSGNLGSININRGNNNISIHVEAEDGSISTYSVLVVAYSNENDILNIDVNQQEDIIDFDPNTFIYTFDVLYTTDYITLDVTASNHAVITGEGTIYLNEGENILYVYAVSEYGEQGQVYQVIVNRAFVSDNANLASLVITDAATQNELVFNPTFDPNKTNYIINLSEETQVNAIWITAETESEFAVVGGTGYKVLKAEVDGLYNNVFELVVRAQDGSIKTYTIGIYQNVELSDLAVFDVISLIGNDEVNYFGSDSNAIHGFSEEVYEYEFTVPYEVEALSLNVTAAFGNAYGSQTLSFIETDTLNYTFSVVSQSGVVTKGSYYITVHREMPVSDNLLETLIVNGSQISGFDSEVLNYTLNIPYQSLNQLIISASPSDPKAIVSGDIGAQQLIEGQQMFKINVQAQDGTISTYTITVNYLDVNPYLEQLKIMDVETENMFEFEFDPMTFEYTVMIDPTVTEVMVSAMAQDQESAAIIGLGRYDTTNEETAVMLYVIASDNVTQEIYRVNIVHEDKLSSNTNLVNLSVPGYAINYSQQVQTYHLSVDEDISQLSVIAEAEDPNATITIEGAEQLKAGNNVILIKVEAQDGTTEYYKINVVKDGQEDVFITVLLIVTFLMWVITVLFFLFKQSRDKQNQKQSGLII